MVHVPFADPRAEYVDALLTGLDGVYDLLIAAEREDQGGLCSAFRGLTRAYQRARATSGRQMLLDACAGAVVELAGLKGPSYLAIADSLIATLWLELGPDPIAWPRPFDTVRNLHLSPAHIDGLYACVVTDVNPLLAPMPGRKRRSPRRRQAERPLTPRQAEVVHIVGECNGNLAAAARRLRIDRKTGAEHYRAAMHKLGLRAVRHRTRPIPRDRRSQAALSPDDDRR